MLVIQEIGGSDMSPDEPTPAHLDWRLTEMERRFGEMHAHINSRFDQLSSQVSSLPVVRLDLYLSEKASMSEKVENAHRLAMWAVGLTASTTVGAILTGILTVSGAFR